MVWSLRQRTEKYTEPESFSKKENKLHKNQKYNTGGAHVTV